MTIFHDKFENVIEYFKANHLLEIFECLITGLITVCPEEPLEWIASGIEEIEHEGIESISWDKYIPDDMKLQVKEVTETYVDAIMFGTSTEPSSELLTRAYEFYWRNLMEKTFKAYKDFYLANKARKLRIQNLFKSATGHCRHKNLVIHFMKWLAWIEEWKDRKKQACLILQSVYRKSLNQIILTNWHEAAKEERRTKEYFERLEKGLVEEEDAEFSKLFRKKQKDAFSNLPNKCIMKIFGFLNLIELAKCAGVCRGWRVLTGSSVLWTTINFFSIRRLVVDDFVLDCMHKYRAYVVHLNLRQCCNVFSPTLKLIAGCRNLQDLNLYDCSHANDDVMKAILEKCKSLLYLNISYCEVTDATLRTLGNCCVNLQYLSISYCVKLTDKGLQSLGFGRGCSRLVYLDVSGCCNLTSEGFLFISQCCRYLQSLYLNDLPFINDSSLVNLSRLHGVRALSMLGASNVTDSGLKAFAINKKIQKLRVESARLLTDYSLKIVGRCCHLLAHLYLVDCPLITDATLRYLAHLRHLVVLNLTDCIRISDLGLRQFIDGNSGQRIREINLTNCIKISDFSLMRIGQKCCSLSHLVVCFCDRITDCGPDLLTHLPRLSHIDLTATSTGDKGLSALSLLGNIKSVSVSECSNVSDLGVEKFSLFIPQLEIIDLSHCTAITDNAIRNLVYYCRNLTNVNLAGCLKLTDKSVQYLTGVSKYMHVLNLSGCINLTNKCIVYFRNRPMQLHFLSMLYCKNISSKAVKSIEGKFDHLEHNEDPVPSWFNYDCEINSKSKTRLNSAVD